VHYRIKVYKTDLDLLKHIRDAHIHPFPVQFSGLDAVEEEKLKTRRMRKEQEEKKQMKRMKTTRR
jgi:hypothetical protein